MRSVLEAIAPSAKLLPLSGESQWEGCANSPSLTGTLINQCETPFICTYRSPQYVLQGLQLHHQWWRAANVCRQPHLCSLLQQIHQLLGVVRPILDLHNITCSVGAILNKHALIWLGQVRSQGPQRCCHQSLTRRVTSLRFLWIFYFAETLKSLRCAQHWLLRGTWRQMSHWSWTVKGEKHSTCSRPPHQITCRWSWSSWPPARRGSSPATMASVSSWSSGEIFLDEKSPKNHEKPVCCLSPAVTKLPTVSTNQTKTIANCSPWKWELIYFCLLTPSTQDNYNKKIAPFSFDKVLKAVVPVNINVSLSVIDILKIKEVDHIYILKFCLVLEWYTKFL